MSLYIHNTAAQSVDCYGVNWFATSFTSTSDARITDFVFLLTKLGAPSGNITIALKANSGGVPTGADLTSVSRTASTIGTGQQNETFTLATPYVIIPATVYHIVMSVPSGTVGNGVAWYRSTSDTFAGGNFSTSVNSGGAWSSTGYDGDFAVNGSINSTFMVMF